LVRLTANPIMRVITTRATMPVITRILPLQSAKGLGTVAIPDEGFWWVVVTASFSVAKAVCFPSTGTTSRPAVGAAPSG
jgi:hypothetical protein